jgi:tetratricopeptide (TPR) repeat protein
VKRRAAALVSAGALLALLAPVAHASAAGTVAAHAWSSVRTAHVEVVTDATSPVAMRIALRLESLREALALLLPPLVVDASPVQVIVFRDESLARAYAPTWRGLQDEVAGFSHAGPDRRRVLIVDDQGRMPSVAQHEYVHSLLDVAWSDSPLWLNEGLAEYFSTFTADDGRAHAGAPVPGHVEWLDAHDLMPLQQLFTIDQASPDYHEGDRRGTFYAQSWALTHLLLSGPESDLERLARVLVACRDGARFETVFTREFGSEQSLRERLHAQLEQGRWLQRTWQLPSSSGASPRTRARTPAAEVLGSLALEFLSRQTAQREDAEAHLSQALLLDARAPDALAGMGWLELMRARRTEARGWFDRVLQVEPTSGTAVRVLASQLLLDVVNRQELDERGVVGAYVRRALERALAATPGDPELVALLARSWAVSYGDDPEPGYEPAVRAARALPGRTDVQLDLLALCALTGRDVEARKIFAQRFGDGASAEARHVARQALLAGAVHRASRSVQSGDVVTAEALLDAVRAQVADDPALARQAQTYLDSLHVGTRRVAEVDQQNKAIAEYNKGVTAGNAGRYAEAEAAFRRAAALSALPEFQVKARRLATRMHQHQDGERAFTLARQGQVAEAIAIFEAMDRAAMSAEDRKWLDTNLSLLRARKR